MKKIVIAALLLLTSVAANALEISGIKIPEKTQSGERTLLLNGAGVKLMAFVYPVYVLALYLPEKKHTVDEVLAESLSKKLVLSFTYSGATPAQLLDATRQLMSENLNAEDLKKQDTGWKAFAAIFNSVKDFKRGDQLGFDYNATTGMQVTINGNALGNVGELDFMRGFLMVWLGNNPAQPELKNKLLGQ
ncbi:MAG: chalcone isomerase family protein [Gallionellaceae bacterium]